MWTCRCRDNYYCGVMMILVIDDDEVMRECVARSVRRAGREVVAYGDAFAATSWVAENGAPEMILMDVMLNGPDGFTFLNEMASYADTGVVPVILVVENRKYEHVDLAEYGVVKILYKDTMRPSDVSELVRDLTGENWERSADYDSGKN